MVPRSPRTASPSPALEVARRWSARGAALLEYFAGISSCVCDKPRSDKARVRDLRLRQETYQVPSATSINVPMAQLLAANGPIYISRQYVCLSESDGDARERTDAEPTYDANADATRNTAQETVPRARNFADALQVFTRRQSLLVHQALCQSERASVQKEGGGGRKERRRTLNASRTSDQ